MTLALGFWILMLIWAVFGVSLGWRVGPDPNSRFVIGGNLLIFVLLAILGWAQFGGIIHGHG